MKKLFVLAITAVCFSAFAGEGQVKPASGMSIDAKQQQQQQAQADATNAGNSQTIVFEAVDNTAATREAGAADINVALINAAAARDVAGTTATIKNTPSVSGSPLVSSNDTCMGSSSGSVNAPGIGISLGSTWVDENCKMLKNSRELWNMGMKAASLALMCNDAANREALELTGFECPQTTKAKKQAAASAAPAPAVASVNGYIGNDPIVLQRIAGK